MSHSTMAFDREGRQGPALFYCEVYFAFEILGHEGTGSTDDGYNGWRLGSLVMAHPMAHGRMCGMNWTGARCTP